MQVPDSNSPYGWSGPLFPGDFGLSGEDLDGADSHRVGLAIGSFQRWANQADAAGSLGPALRTDGIYDEPTHNKLVALTGSVPKLPTMTVPGNTSPIPTYQPPPTTTIAKPGGGLPGVPGASDDLPGSATIGKEYPPTLPPSLPGSIIGSQAKNDDAPIWPWVAIGTGVVGLTVIGFHLRRKRRRSA